MHFWIDKRATSFQYGRRRPTFYSSGTFASSAFGRQRNSIGSLRPSSTSSTPREEYTSRLSPRRFYYGDNQHYQEQSRSERHDHNYRPPRRPSTYPPIPDPAVQEALNQLQHELEATLAGSSPPRTRPQSGRRYCFTTKHLGLSLCFMGFILLCTVAGKFIVEGPSVLDSSRRSSSPSSRHPLEQTNNNRTSVSFFLISEIIFVVFALGLFLTGVACLRKQTNEYLLRQFRQHIINTSSHQSQNDIGGSSSSNRSSGSTLIAVTDNDPIVNGEPSPLTLALYGDPSSNRRERRSHRYMMEGLSQPGRSRRCYNYSYNTHQVLQTKQKPPPYEVALYLPLPNQHLPHHTNTLHHPLTASQQSDPEKVEKAEGVEDICSPSEQQSVPKVETPPPCYMEFSYEI